MLLKYTKTSGAGSGAGGSTTSTYIARGTGMRMTMSTASTMTPRIHRKGFRTPSKRYPGKALPGKLHSISRIGPGKLVPGKRIPQRPHPPPCDNSNDSGFGFDQHLEVPQSQQQQQQQQQQNGANANNNNGNTPSSTSTNNGQLHISPNSSTSGKLSSHATQQHPQQQQQQHHQQQLIRAIPASRSSYATSTNDDDETSFAITDEDSDDYYGQDNLGGGGMSIGSRTSSTSSSSQDYPMGGHHHHVPRSHKVRKIESHVDLDNDDACSEDAFIRKIANATCISEMDVIDVPQPTPPMPPATLVTPPTTAVTKFLSNSGRNMARVAHKRQPATPLNTIATSSDGRVQLEIVSQPEQQHRARYQTEGSRGAVKDRSGNGFPIVRLTGYSKPAVLQVFIGTDIGRVAPHMFYQACKVAGKNSTQCNEKKVDGTMVIEIDFKPETDMTITCDCVGILKERNVDVEHRFPDHLAQKNKKKSTRCRMVFRTQLAHDDGTMETLQVCSNPIICTQPPGVPEICKKSLNSCPVDGGLELFVVGKNFLKDTHVVFQETFDSANPDDPNSDVAVRHQMVGTLWEQTVLPDKEYLQQTHLICTVPPYIHQNIMKPVQVQVSIISSGKKSEPHSFVYTPKGSYTTLSAATTLSSSTLHGSLSAPQDPTTQFMDTSAALAPHCAAAAAASLWPAAETKHEIDSGMMPPPISTQMPMGVRRPSLPTSTPMITDQQLAHLNAVVAAEALKTELLDESSQSSLADAMHSPEAVTNGCDPHSPNALQYHHSRYARKQSLDAMMYESNSLPGFPPVAPGQVAPPPAVATASTPMDVTAAMVVGSSGLVKNEFDKDILSVVQQQQQAASVDKFISDLAQSTAVNTPTRVAEQALFNAEHAFSDILQQAGVAAPPNQQSAVLERTLSMSSSSSSLSSQSSSSSPLSANSGASPTNSLNGHSSPLSQDIILNSEPAANLSALPLQQLLPTVALTGTGAASAANPVVPDVASGSASNGGLSPDIILNPSVSPSTILCSANGAATAVVPNIMAPHQVTMANSILNNIAMQPQPTQQDAAVAALALSNIIMPPGSTTGVNNATAASPTGVAGQPEVPTATSTAVSNMIIKAAAEFISTQEQQQQQHCHQQQQQQPQPQMLPPNVATAPTADPLVNLLLNHPDVPPSTAVAVQAVSAVAAVADVQTPFPLGIPPSAPQESLIVALATENALQKSVAAAAVTTNGAVVTQQTPAATAGIHGPPGTPQVPLPQPIPQELTTMSDQDLISYINPSTFDQI